ncbi:MAG: DUF697 domain-containing protein [Spirochaetaceae bacterium]|nr:DUF697 domain-containing protein [Spirochaetaceae bacterium]
MQPASAPFDRFEDSGNILSVIERAIREAAHEIGTVNILIAGRTGVGKSTLINEVFQGRLATTGQGEPVTKQTRRYTKKGIPLTIYDTRGLELKEYEQIIGELVQFVGAKNRLPDHSEHIHVAWVCLSEDGRRVEQAEMELHRRLADFMPVLGVITKARSDEGFRAEVQRLLPAAKNVVRVRALSERFDGATLVLPPMGLEELVDATAELVPEAVRRAFAAAQKASLELRKKAAHKVVVAAAGAAVAAGAVPIPFADAAVLVPIQVSMLAGISATFGIELSKAFFSTLVAAMAGTTGATFLGRAVVANLLKFIPGGGSVAGGVVAAGAAATLTTALGELYIAVLAKLFTASGGTPPSPEAIAQEFAREFKNRMAAKRD